MVKYKEVKERETYGTLLTLPANTNNWQVADSKFKCVYDKAKIKLIKIYFEDGSDGFNGRTYVKVYINSEQVIPRQGDNFGGYGGVIGDGDERIVFMEREIKVDDEIKIYYENTDNVDHDVFISIEMTEIVNANEIIKEKPKITDFMVKDENINVKVINAKKSSDTMDRIKKLGLKVLKSNPFLDGESDN